MGMKWTEFDWMFDAPHWGQMVKEARLREGLTQEAIAKFIGVTASAIGAWERGSFVLNGHNTGFMEYGPNMGKYIELCNLMGIDPRAAFVLIEEKIDPDES